MCTSAHNIEPNSNKLSLCETYVSYWFIPFLSSLHDFMVINGAERSCVIARRDEEVKADKIDSIILRSFQIYLLNARLLNSADAVCYFARRKVKGQNGRK